MAMLNNQRVYIYICVYIYVYVYIYIYVCVYVNAASSDGQYWTMPNNFLGQIL